jgi:hypothetical protein
MTTIKLETNRLLGYVEKTGACAAKDRTDKLTGAKVGVKDSPSLAPTKLAGAKVGDKPTN